MLTSCGFISFAKFITKIFSISFTKWVNENYVKTISTYTQKDKLYWDADNFTLEFLFDKFTNENQT